MRLRGPRPGPGPGYAARVLTHRLNRQTQPHRPMAVFGNWDVIAKGWYVACRSDELPRRAARPVELHGQRLVVFRGEDGVARTLDAFCPHMGTDLAEGKVVGNVLRCYFHHWTFDGAGRCTAIPALRGQPAPERARVATYATAERYGCVWVWPEAAAPAPLPEFEGLEGADLVAWLDRPVERTCHHHVCMINGIDPQHLSTVHGLDIEMRLSYAEADEGRVVDFVLEGELPPTLLGRLGRALIGPTYRYGMRYAGGCLGMLTTVKGLSLFGSGPRLPELHMLYAYTPLAPGRIRIQPIFVARRRRGPLGWLWTRLLLFFTLRGYRTLQGEDGRVYDHMRFDPAVLLPIDGPVARFIAWVNRLEPSRWSQVALSPPSPPSESG